ncbi:hypothetical protein EIP91_002340 [Steccherinum ochraceum]|uniref:Protein YOP1 n=1 Tax=Steccherinum ochraceum TaxID=92696 RepID=A0A4V2MWC0_9APHY|nr:hypothetical protein EIP91_002340 [Steccherinum ochraceum]
MYWSIVGSFVAFEYVAEWFISWFPFYWEVKTILLLFLALPQTQGSTWVYKSYLDPFLAPREADIDAGITAAQANLLNFIQDQIKKVWENIWRMITGALPANSMAPPANGQPAPAPNPFSLAKGMWETFGPAFMGSLQSHTQANGAANGAQRPQMSPAGSNYSASSHSNPGTPSFPEPQPYI